MKPLFKKRASVEGTQVDFIYLEDADFRTLMLEDHKAFINEHKQGNVAIALIGYPSFNSIVSEMVNFSVDQAREMYPCELKKQA